MLKHKYLKYKNKYLEQKLKVGGVGTEETIISKDKYENLKDKKEEYIINPFALVEIKIENIGKKKLKTV